MTPTAPFLIYGLPRSRTRWLSRFLAYDGWTVYHDIPLSVASLADLKALLSSPRVGAIETSLSRAAPMFYSWFPGAPVVVVRRPVPEVRASMERIGWTTPAGFLESEDRNLDMIGRLPTALSVPYHELSTATGCRAVFEHCLRRPFDYHHWRSYAAQNIQVDAVARTEEVIAKTESLQALFTEINSYATIQIEPFEDVLRDGQSLFALHQAEAGSFAGLPFDPDIEQFRAFDRAGALLAITARTPLGLVGYLGFLLSPCLESRARIWAHQNVFFVHPEHRGSLGPRMHAFARAELKRRQVDAVILRSGVRARGPDLKHLFRRMGAKTLGELYYLSLGDL